MLIRRIFNGLWLFALLVMQDELVIAQNLVPNGSFEEFEFCPTTSSFVPSNWYCPTLGTADHYHSCSPSNSTVHVPNNQFGYQEAFHGEGYVGLHSNSLNAEYLQCKLKDTLQPCKEYSISFRINLPDYSPFTTQDFGIRLDKEPMHVSNGFSIIEKKPDLYLTSPLTDSVSWTLVEGKYFAKGYETYLTIGCFPRNGELVLFTSPEYIGTQCEICIGGDAYFFVDSVQVLITNDKSDWNLPNVFTPNNDGVNDNVSISDFPVDEIVIIDRWGSEVSKINEMNNSWDGTTNDKDCAEGVYFYTSPKCPNEINGFIHLVR